MVFVSFFIIYLSCCGFFGSCANGMIEQCKFGKTSSRESSFNGFRSRLYAEKNCMYNATKMFDKISQRDGVLWNVMIDWYFVFTSRFINVNFYV